MLHRMATHTKILLVSVAALSLGTAACGSKSKKEVTEPAVTAGPSETKTETPTDAKTEVVDGELRDAILKLRRVHFAHDTETLTDDGQKALTEAGETLVKYPEVHIYVQGHADERGTSEYNIALGERRARVVSDYLTRLGVDPSRLHIVSYGEDQPLATGHSDVAMAKNRRVDFKLMRGEVQLIVEEGTIVDDEGAPIETP